LTNEKEIWKKVFDPLFNSINPLHYLPWSRFLSRITMSVRRLVIVVRANGLPEFFFRRLYA